EHEEQCSVCGCKVEPEYLVCPVCTTKLRSACASCGKPLEPAWQVCPYCETPVTSDEPVPLRPKTQRSRRSSTGTTPAGALSASGSRAAEPPSAGRSLV